MAGTADKPPIRIVVGEDQPIVREGVIRVLEDAGFEVVGAAADAEGVPEIRDEPDSQVAGGGSGWLVRASLRGARSPQGNEPDGQEDRLQDNQPGEQQEFGRQCSLGVRL